jgi:putative flavoprotein involved in K+ transport
VPTTSVVIIGAGQAGLAMSRCLSEHRIEHVVLERGSVAERWRQHGWDSLRLLTPNWMTRLPGFAYRGDEPDSFMTVTDLIALLEQYAAESRAPVVHDREVLSVERNGDAFDVATTADTWRASAVVIATGYCDRPAVPSVSRKLASWVQQITPAEYRSPHLLPPYGVLIVGASSTGVQIADEIQRSGRQVVLAVGRHTRLPRRYRGRDILWWLDQLGVLSQEASTVHDLAVSRSQPSLQLIGRPGHSNLDLEILHRQGIRLAGRVVDMKDTTISFADDLISTTAAADIKMATVLLRIDEFIRQRRLDVEKAAPFVPTWAVAADAPTRIDLGAERIGAVIWATGYRRDYPWLRVPILDSLGEIQHRSGVTPARGLYVLGLNFQRRRHSSFIDGVGDDASYLAQQIATQLSAQRTRERAAEHRWKVC